MFNYEDAFSRNIGWLTEQEQTFIRSRKVAIAGMGGVGSEHLVTLCRLGISHFNISDFDDYEVHNFNRQAGAYMSTVGRPKCEVMEQTTIDINPESTVRSFPEGINESNVDDFLDGVDIYVDSLDFFALAARKLVFKRCEELGIPVVTAAPLGMGTAILCFSNDSMPFEKYFDFQPDDTEDDAYIKFLIWLSPAMLQRNYLVDPSKADFKAKKGPSTGMAVKLCAGTAGTVVLKILLNRGDVPLAPKGLHFDAYNNKLKITWRPWGNKNPLQNLVFKIAKKVVLGTKETKQESANSHPTTLAEKVLDIARWAPSGDNTQVWRFELTSETSFNIHGYDTRDWVVYDLQGNASKLAIGCLIENISLAANAFGHQINYILEQSNIENAEAFKEKGTYLIKVSLKPDSAEISSTDKRLFDVIPLRTTQRRTMGTSPLTQKEKQFFEDALPEGYSLIWKESPEERMSAAKLLYGNAKTRLSMKEGYDVHSKIIEFTPRSLDQSANSDTNDEISRDKIPGKALGVGPVMQFLTKKTLQSWPVLDFTGKYLGGTILPRILLDFLPGYKSSAIFAIKANTATKTDDDYIAAGRAVQRVWLASAALNLGFQPCQTPVIFSEYLREGVKFTSNEATQKNAKVMEEKYTQFLGVENTPNIVFMGRVGRSKTPKYRSVRLSLSELNKPSD